MAAAAATVVVVGRRHRGEGGERDGRTRGLCRPGGPSSSHTCSPLLLLLLSPLHFTQSPLSIDCYFHCFSPRHLTANASGGEGRPTGAADASEGGGRGRLARSRSVRRSRSVIPTREDERERGRKRGKNGTDAPDGSRGGRGDADEGSIWELRRGKWRTQPEVRGDTPLMSHYSVPMPVAHRCQNKHAFNRRANGNFLPS